MAWGLFKTAQHYLCGFSPAKLAQAFGGALVRPNQISGNYNHRSESPMIS